MNRKLLKIVFSFTLMLSILLPMGISFAHSLHKHDQNYCTATDEHHIHNEHFNCSVFHYIPQTNFQKSTFHCTLFTPKYKSFKPIFFSSFFTSLDPHSSVIRGPPSSMLL